MWWFKRSIFIVTLVAACGFTPVHQNGAAVPEGAIYIAQIDGRAGQVMRTELLRRLGNATADARYELKVSVAFSENAIAVAQDTATTRFRVSANAQYEFLKDGVRMGRKQARASTSYSAEMTSYPTRIAQADARERLARYLAGEIANYLLLMRADWFQEGLASEAEAQQ